MTWALANAKLLRSGMKGVRYNGKPAPRLKYDPMVHKLDVDVAGGYVSLAGCRHAACTIA
eukprot:54868-Eustigmatos_ZCMA.PRE.1